MKIHFFNAPRRMAKMAYERQELECEDEINRARRAVAAEELAYRKGGSPDELNRANRRLADAHWRHYEVCGGLVPEKR
jgi:hypothetical protein